MRAPHWTRLMNPLGWAASAVLVLAVAWALWWFVFVRPADNAREAKAARVESALSAARTESAKDAIGTIDTNRASQDAIDRQVQDAIETIAAADDPDAAALRELCQFKSAARLPECLQRPGP